MALMLVLGSAAAGCAGASVNARPSSSGYDLEGEAAWYGEDFQGRPTASGEAFDMNDLTAAHPDLPFGTTVRVTRPDTGQSVVVRINDRGPYTRGRIIDLSYAAAREIDMVSAGILWVTIEILSSTDH
jgi:rare lipoprotein A